MVGTGHFYAARLFAGMDLDPEAGAVRLSFVHYTSKCEIEAAISALDKILNEAHMQ